MDFERIVEEYSERIYWTVRRLVASHDDANDVVQNVFIKVWQALDNFKGNASIYTWLYRIAINESLTFLRTSRAHNLIGGDAGEREMQSLLDSSCHFDGDAVERSLQMAIQKLPERQRAVFLMRYYDETPYAQMAEILNVSQGALKASYHHAAKKIEEQLNISIL